MDFMKGSAGAGKKPATCCGDQINTAEKLCEAGAGDLIKDLEAPFLTDKETGTFHDGEMLGECRDITSCQIREIVDTQLPFHQGLHDQKPCRVGHRFHNPSP